MPDITREQVWVDHPNPIRLKSVVFGQRVDYSLEDTLREFQIPFTAQDVETVGFVGTFYGGPVREYRYTLEGKPWFAYEVIAAEIDSFQSEWWVSETPMDAHTAAAYVVGARELWRKIAQEQSRNRRRADA